MIVFLFFLDWVRVKYLLELVNWQFKRYKKLFTGYYCLYCVHESSISSWPQCVGIISAKTTSKRRSTARAVRTAFSTRGLLPLCFFVVFYAFYLRASLRIVKHRRLDLLYQCVTPIWRITHHELLFTNFVILTKEESPRVARTSTFYFSRLLSFLCLFFSFVLITHELLIYWSSWIYISKETKNQAWKLKT